MSVREDLSPRDVEAIVSTGDGGRNEVCATHNGARIRGSINLPGVGSALFSTCSIPHMGSLQSFGSEILRSVR